MALTRPPISSRIASSSERPVIHHDSQRSLLNMSQFKDREELETVTPNRLT